MTHYWSELKITLIFPTTLAYMKNYDNLPSHISRTKHGLVRKVPIIHVFLQQSTFRYQKERDFSKAWRQQLFIGSVLQGIYIWGQYLNVVTLHFIVSIQYNHTRITVLCKRAILNLDHQNPILCVPRVSNRKQWDTNSAEFDFFSVNNQDENKFTWKLI